MADYEYGHCGYCGKYRPMKWNGGYCSQRCYKMSGQSSRDAQNARDVEALWYEDDDIFSAGFRTIVMTIGWTLFLFFFSMWMNNAVKGGYGIVGIANALDALINKPVWFVPVIACAVISIIQNIIVRGKDKGFRCFIYYGIPAIFAVLTVVFYFPHSFSHKLYEMTAGASEKKAEKNIHARSRCRCGAGICVAVHRR